MGDGLLVLNCVRSLYKLFLSSRNHAPSDLFLCLDDCLVLHSHPHLHTNALGRRGRQ
jgi:hypothetical protein